MEQESASRHEGDAIKPVPASGDGGCGGRTDNSFRISWGPKTGNASSYWLTRFVILRLVGLVYFVAFLLAARQIIPLIGQRGLLPAETFLHRVETHFGSRLAAFLQLPSLFWFNVSDRFIAAMAWVGVGLSLIVLLGYANAILMSLLWALYLSFVHVGQDWYSYGWEIQLLETGFLAIFLCPLLEGRPFLVNTYGAFGSVGRERHEIVFEGTDDPVISSRTQWKEYEFKCKPGDPLRRPCIVSPYHHRLDWQIWFAAMSVPEEYPWTLHFVWKLLHNDTGTLGLLADNPFPDKPPRYTRAELFRYEFAPPGDPGGGWWKRTPLGLWLPPLSVESPALRRFLAAQGWLPAGESVSAGKL